MTIDHRPTAWTMMALLAVSCGQDSNDARPGASAEGGSLVTTATASAGNDTAAPATGEGDGSGADTSPTTTMAVTSTTMSADESADDGSVFDVGTPDVPACSGSGAEDVDFSYIWVANSAEGTVSKLDTTTLTELGRYIVRPDSAGNPSRTSVNLSGDVAVANRAGDIVKIFAQTEDCADTNGTPGIQTSSGANDVLAWGEEECIAWYADLPYNAQRPVAWTAGTFDADACAWVDQAVWTTGANLSTAGSVHAMRLNGDTGALEIDLPVPELSVGSFGPYGGAVDAVGDFWFHSRDAGLPHPLVHVDADGASYEIIDVPDPVAPYGITVDSNGRIWLAGYQGGLGRYDPMLGTWDTLDGFTGLGIQEDANGVMWMAIFPWDSLRGVHAFDVDTMTHLSTIDMSAEAPSSRGVSIDFDGYVWMVDQASSAWKIDPTFGTWERYDGLTGPYTYSDMTGWGLSLVTRG